MSVQRIATLRKKILANNLDGMIVNHLDYIRYLTGYTGSAGLLIIGKKSADFFTDFRYTDQARKEVKGAKIHIVAGGLLSSLDKYPKLDGQNLRYGIDDNHVDIATLRLIEDRMPRSIFIPAKDLLADLGWVKDKDEIASITKAAGIADLALERVLNLVTPGVRERELAAELEYQMAMMGSEKPAFESIVASGYRSAMPHGVASMKKIKKGDFITFDWGATVNGYVSDCTRTVVVGKATTRQKKIYNIVKKAQMAGVRKIKAGVTGKAVDAVCRNIITKAGYGKNFGHGTGHGIGFFVHVGPSLGESSKDQLKANHVVTVEPGIYVSGWGGVRIEDDVVVTRTGGKVLNKAPKNLLEL